MSWTLKLLSREQCVSIFSQRDHILNGDKFPCINKKNCVSTKGYSNPCQLSNSYGIWILNKACLQTAIVNWLELWKCENVYISCETYKIIFVQKFIFVLFSLLPLSPYILICHFTLVFIQCYKEKKHFKILTWEQINLANW